MPNAGMEKSKRSLDIQIAPFIDGHQLQRKPLARSRYEKRYLRESLRVTDVQPNHGWRHPLASVRGTRMKPELCDYMCGHESKSGTGARYGKRKVPVLAGDGIIPTLQGARTPSY